MSQEEKWEAVLETYASIISCRENMPGMSLESAFSPRGLELLKDEYEWLKRMAITPPKEEES